MFNRGKVRRKTTSPGGWLRALGIGVGFCLRLVVWGQTKHSTDSHVASLGLPAEGGIVHSSFQGLLSGKVLRELIMETVGSYLHRKK